MNLSHAFATAVLAPKPSADALLMARNTSTAKLKEILSHPERWPDPDIRAAALAVLKERGDTRIEGFGAVGVETKFTLNRTLTAGASRAPSAHVHEREWREGTRGRYVVVRVNKGGDLPKSAEVGPHNAVNTIEGAQQVLARIAALNPGFRFVVVDRITRTVVNP